MQDERVLSGSKFIDHRGNKNAERRNPIQEVPDVGTFILYNEKSQSFLVGNPGYKAKRGVGRVIKYTNHMMMIEVNITPTYSTTECFRINDIRLGILQWQPLKKFVYIKEKYSYAELDIKNLHKDLQELIIEKEEEWKYS